MDYKEKYEHALENIKKIKAANKDNKELVDFIEYKYPELIESEDEKIRKWLIEMVEEVRKANPTNAKYNGICSNAISWLEKQGEQKPTNEVESEFKAGDFIADGIRTLLVLANKEERNLGETYSTYCEGLVLTVHGNVLVDDKDFSGFRLATDIERANFVHDLKVGTKINYKSAEWSEEDENLYNKCMSAIQNRYNDGLFTTNEYRQTSLWLKSLKERMKGE